MDACFLSPLRFQDDGGLPFMLTEDLLYQSNVLDKRTLRVPMGFKTDLASSPRLLWNVIPPMGKYDAGAVLHDYLYQHNGVTRKQADDVLLEAMRVLQVGWWARATIYSGVRVGGWKVWNKYRRA